MANKKRSKPRRSARRAAQPGGFPISLVMIVRDEEATLSRCLESVRGLVDEIVIVDTGSTDATVRIAESHGATVGHFTWVDDFAAARNAALDLAAHPWRLVMDADEWFADREQAKRALDAVRTTRPDYIGLVKMKQVDPDGSLRNQTPSLLPRFAPKRLRYVGRVHEQLVPQLQFKVIDLLLGHDGYTPEANARKDGRNIALLEAALEEDPTDAYRWYQLGVDHQVHHRTEQALPYLAHAYNLTHPLDGTTVTPVGEARTWWHDLLIRLMAALLDQGRVADALELGEQEVANWERSSEFLHTFGVAARDRARELASVDPQTSSEMMELAVGCWIAAVDLGDTEAYGGSLRARGSVAAAEALAPLFERRGQLDLAAKYRAVAGLSDPAAGTLTA